MKVTAVSDCHGLLLPIEEFEPCELVCICGDISPLNIQANHKKMRKWLIKEFKPWCESLPCDKVIFIAGNHDSALQNLDFMYTQFPKDKKVTYLFHENYVYTSKSGKEYTGEEALKKACSDYVIKRNSGKTLKDSMDGARTCGFSFEIEHICKDASKQGNFNLNKAFGL